MAKLLYHTRSRQDEILFVTQTRIRINNRPSFFEDNSDTFSAGPWTKHLGIPKIRLEVRIPQPETIAEEASARAEQPETTERIDLNSLLLHRSVAEAYQFNPRTSTPPPLARMFVCLHIEQQITTRPIGQHICVVS